MSSMKLKVRIAELEAQARDSANRNVARMGEFENLLGANKQKIADLEAQLQAALAHPVEEAGK